MVKKSSVIVAICGLILQACAANVAVVERVPAEQSSADFSILETTIAKVHTALQAHTLTCKTLVSKYLARIKQYDQQTQLNAIIMVNPNAMSKAEALDTEFKQTSRLRPLHCVPVILKDNFDTADMPTAGGSMVLKDSIPPDDAHVVSALRQAGAIILAKSNMAEWAFSPYVTISSTRGETRNAYDLQRVPAGSSGGTASAVAANFGLVGLGTDTGNSIRGPSSHLALVGIRSTIGVVSRDGIIPLLYNRDVAGPMTRTVEDAARILSIIAGPDPADPASEAATKHIPKNYADYLNPQGLKGAKIGILRAVSNTDTTDFEIAELFSKAIADMKRLGADIVDPFDIPELEKLTKATGFCSRFRYDVDNYFASLGESAPVKHLQEVADEGRYLPSSQGAFKWAMSVDVAPERQETPCVDVYGDPRRKALRDAVVNAMDALNVDALIYPTWNNPPRLLGDMESPHGNNSPILSPHADQPAITVPMGFTSNQLPAGLQILGRPYSEAMLLKFAYAYEQATLHRKPPAVFP
jgi:Asp-tRNA(Asn)/Glu-tRNA(Gln) amidotransferase A subunit family amidase